MGYWKEVMGEVMSLYAVIMQYFPAPLFGFLVSYYHKFLSLVSPYVTIEFPEYAIPSACLRSELYMSIETYLSEQATKQAMKLRAEKSRGSSSTLLIAVNDHEEVTDEFQGAKVWWYKSSQRNVNINGNGNSEAKLFPVHFRQMEKRVYALTFHKCHRSLVIDTYLNHVMDEVKEIEKKSWKQYLYYNNEDGWYHRTVFQNTATFETLALKPDTKEAILNYLLNFKNGKDYHMRIGMPWKRTYLVHGPPGTGKSSMIAAMANFLKYDVYDLELKTVKDDSMLRGLLMEIESKSVVVIEDIDCSIDLTGQREKKKKKSSSSTDNDDDEGKFEAQDRKVTLSGLLNVIDGIWSSCGEERIIVFTTNFVEKLDPDFISRARMVHIEMGNCCFEGFKVLAKNYLNIESHPLFPTIEKLLEEKAMAPSDVIRTLMYRDAGIGFLNLIEALEMAKFKEQEHKTEENEKERKKATEEKRTKAMEKAGEKGRKKPQEEKQQRPIRH